MTFDLGWPLTVLDLGHRTCTSDIWNTVSDTMLDTIIGGQIGNQQWAFD